MSDIQKSVLLKIDIDNSDGERRLAEIRDEINKLKESQDKNTRATQEQKDAYEKSAIAVKSLQQEQRNLQGVMVAQTNAAKANKGSFNELYNQWKAAEAQLKNLSGTIQKNEDGTMSLTAEYVDQAREVDKLKQTLLLFNAGIAQGNLNVGNYGNTLDGMRNKLKDLGVVIQTTDVGTEEFRKAKEEAEKLSTEIQIAEGKIDSMGNKVAKNSIKDTFNDITGATQALSGALGVAMLAAGDSEEAQERLRKAMGAVALAQTALTIARQKDDILQSAAIVKTKLQTAAQWALNNAVAAFGIGAAVAGLTFFITKLIGSKDATDDQTESQGDLNAELEKTVDLYQELSDQMTSLSSGETAEQIRDLERLRDIRKAQGADNIELLEIEGQLLRAQLKELQNIDQAMSTSGEAFGDKALELQQDIKDLQNAIKVNTIETQKEIEKATMESNERLSEAANKLLLDSIKANEALLKSNVQAAWDYYAALNAAIGAAVSDSQKQFDAMGEEITDTADDTANLIFESFKTNRDKQKEESEQMMEQWLSYATATSDALASVLGNAIGGSYDTVKDFQRDLLKVSLTALKNAFQLALAQGAFKEIASKGIAGILTSAITTIAVETAYSAALAGIEGFATGGKIKGGTPIQRSNGDDVLITAKRGEVILNDGQQRRLERMGGRDVWSRLGVPGFADGGFVPRQIAGEAAYNVNMSAMRDLQDVIRSMPAPVLQYREFAQFENSVRMADKVSGL